MTTNVMAAGYIRVSTQEQAQKGVSLETQRAEIEAYCKLKGFLLTEIYEDRGISARKSLKKREGFMRMMNDVKAKRINHIVVLRLDRFFRNVYDYHKMMAEYLEPNHCSWSAVREEYDTSTTNGRLMINLRLAISEQECDQDSDRIKDVFANRIREGYAISGKVPLGYTIVDQHYVVNEQAPLIKEIFNNFIKTGSIRHTMTIIQTEYNFPIAYKRTREILQNETYTGKRRDNESYCEPIIDRETFDLAQKLMEKNVRYRIHGNEFTFSGLIYCEECDHSMSGIVNRSHKNERKCYRCKLHYVDRMCGNTKQVREDYIERYLLDHVENDLKAYVESVREKEKDLIPVRGNRDQIMRKMDRVMQLYIDGAIDRDDMLRRKAALEAKIIDGGVPPKKDLTPADQFVHSGFLEMYDSFTISEKRFMWKSIIKKIVVGNDGKIKDVVFL